MIHYEKLTDVTTATYKRKGSKYRKTQLYSDTIYTFDIEVSNLFYIDGSWRTFDDTKSKEYYVDVQKLGLPYIWQFGINDTVYYGRDLVDFLKVLKQISDENLCKIIYIHSLAYEFQFLLNIFKDYTIDSMVCRDVHKPISFLIKELNIEFRCSYMLTNLSLAKASEEFTDVKKLDTLDYDSKVRTPLTKLSQAELMYCEYDIICLYKIIKHFKEQYENHVCMIPLTSTGEVRREFKKQVDYFYIRKQQQMTPTSKLYMILWACFSGGYTHSNIINTNTVIEDVTSMDIASSYPYSLLCKLPAKPFRRCTRSEFNTNSNYGYIAYIKLYGVKSRYYTHYMQISKCHNIKGLVADNGRVLKCDYTETWLTSIDFDLIQKNYAIHHYEIVECYKSYLDYLDERIIKFILRLYNNKTKLKGIPEKEAIYKRDKSMLNSLYGMSVTNKLKQSASYDNGWCRAELTDEFIKEKLEEMRHSQSTLLYYGVGVWVTALSRKHLMDCVLYSHDFDRHVIYCDTDSVKYYGNYDHIFNEYNKKIYDSYIELCKRFTDLKVSDFMPVDINGKQHPIGFYEFDGHYDKFKTLGAKKYVAEVDGKLYLTLAGVSKSGVTALKGDINNFQKGLVFDYDTSGKLTHFYNENQPETDIEDADGHIYHSSYSYGITLAPTTYTLGLTEIYDILVYEYMVKECERRYIENGKQKEKLCIS